MYQLHVFDIHNNMVEGYPIQFPNSTQAEDYLNQNLRILRERGAEKARILRDGLFDEEIDIKTNEVIMILRGEYD